MKITILDHNYSHLSETPTKLKDLLSYQIKSFNRRSKRYSISYGSVIDFDTNTTYTGLVPYICQNITTTVEDQRVFPKVNLKVPELSKDLRDYQIDYLEAALRECRMIIHASTGAGKTIMMAATMASLDLPTLIIAPTINVMGQLVTELTNLMPGVKFGLIQGKSCDVHEKFIIGLPQSLAKLPVEDLQRFKVLLVDECHTAAAQTCHDVILSTNAPFRYGFTGTPTGRSDNRDLVVQGLMGKIVQLIERQDLIDQGYLAHTEVEMHRGWFEGNYHIVEDLLIVNNPLRNDLIKKIVDKSRAASVLILVRRIEHGTILQKMFGSSSIFIYGKDDLETREDVREDIKRGRYRILIASNIFGTGMDIPCLELGIFAAGGKAEIGTGQGLGRVVRPWNQMAKRWVDIYDEYCSMMEEQSKERMCIYHDQGVPVNFVGFPPGKQRLLSKELDK